MMRRLVLHAAFAVIASLLTVIPAAAQEAVPDAALRVQAAQPAVTQDALDSLCAARALPLAGAAIFSGLREAIDKARMREPRPPLSPAQATARAATITAGSYAILLFIGLAVLVLAGERLRQVSDVLERDTVGSLLTGLAADLASVPLLAIVVVILAVTLIGILLIPFAVVALLLAYAGLGVLGVLAVASVTGRALLARRRATMTERGAALAGLVLGLTVMLSVWLIAALFSWSPSAGLVLRSVALGLTAVVVTAGVGAVILSFRRAPEEVIPPPRKEDETSWQTPTPVGGVVAVRRSSR
jgi:MFS family permease